MAHLSSYLAIDGKTKHENLLKQRKTRLITMMSQPNCFEVVVVVVFVVVIFVVVVVLNVDVVV